MQIIKCVFLGIGLMLSCSLMYAKSSLEGNWVTIDDKTGEKRAVVHLFVKQDTLYGTIEKVYAKPGDTGVCKDCPGDFKDKPTLGLQFVWGLKEKEKNSWDDGHILDPKSGKIYRAQMQVKSDKLYVRGYVGIPMLGRTQIWEREPIA